MPQLILAIIVAIVIIAMVKHAKKLEKQKSDSFSEMAHQLGGVFVLNPEDSHYDRYQYFQLFTRGSPGKTKNLTTHQDQNQQVEMFEYRYTTSNGKRSTTHLYTVVSITAKNHRFPDFNLRPEHIFHRFGGIFGYQDIDFDSHPEFSKRYLLQGRKVPQIRKLFTSKLMTFLEQGELFSVEAKGNTMIIYQIQNSFEVEVIKQLYQQNQEVYRQFCLALA